jgi:hypothetical protein
MDDKVTDIILKKLDDIEKRVSNIEHRNAWVLGIFATAGFLLSQAGQKIIDILSMGPVK